MRKIWKGMVITMASITRRAARECALKALYSFCFNKESDPSMHFALICAEGEIPANDFAASLFCGTQVCKVASGSKDDCCPCVSVSMLVGLGYHPSPESRP